MKEDSFIGKMQKKKWQTLKLVFCSFREIIPAISGFYAVRVFVRLCFLNGVVLF